MRASDPYPLRPSNLPYGLSNMPCYLCEHPELRPRNGVVRDNPALRILECPNCSLVMLSSIDHIQAGHYENSGMHGESPPSVEASLRNTEADDQRRFEMLASLMVNRSVLDFGCGGAGFAIKARLLASEVAGVEPERRIRDYYCDTIQIHPDLETVEGQWDVVTAFHVVEHLSDPAAVLKQLAERLKDNGRLVIEVPSSDDALLTLYESNAFQSFTYWSQHLYLFNAETLRRLVVKAGLRIVSIQQFQRYPLSNHLYWLSRNRPGGHQQWSFLDNPALNEAYAASLAAIGKCDTLVAHIEQDKV